MKKKLSKSIWKIPALHFGYTFCVSFMYSGHISFIFQRWNGWNDSGMEQEMHSITVYAQQNECYSHQLENDVKNRQWVPKQLWSWYVFVRHNLNCCFFCKQNWNRIKFHFGFKNRRYHLTPIEMVYTLIRLKCLRAMLYSTLADLCDLKSKPSVYEPEFERVFPRFYFYIKEHAQGHQHLLIKGKSRRSFEFDLFLAIKSFQNDTKITQLNFLPLNKLSIVFFSFQ